MVLIAFRWRLWLGFTALGCAAVLAYEGNWLAVPVAAVVLLLLAWWWRGQMAKTRQQMAKIEVSLAEMVAVCDLYAARSADARRRAARTARHGL